MVRGLMTFKTIRPIFWVLVILLSAGCHKMKDMVTPDKEPPLAGERFTVLSTDASPTVDSTLADTEVQIPPPLENLSWPQRGANGANALGAIAVKGFSDQGSASIGDGAGWKTQLVTAPVISDGVVYAMDAEGYVSAHDVADISKVKWVSPAAVTEEKEEILGGGLAAAGGQLFVTTGQGDVYALNSGDGSIIWKKMLGTPMRSAPKMQEGVLFVKTVDDQVFALDSSSGNILWQHRGVGERVGFLSASAPAIGDSFVVVAYASGEIYGLAADSGQEIWNDSLTLAKKTSATSVFSGFDGDPIIAGGVVFASSANGLTAATQLVTGRRLWEQEISALDTPWLGGNFIYIVTTNAEVVALHARDGRVKWVQPLPRYEDAEDKKGVLGWHGPLLLNDQLVVFGSHGEAFALSPMDGKVLHTYEIPSNVDIAPVVAGSALYLVTSDAKLHVMR